MLVALHEFELVDKGLSNINRVLKLTRFIYLLLHIMPNYLSAPPQVCFHDAFLFIIISGQL